MREVAISLPINFGMSIVIFINRIKEGCSVFLMPVSLVTAKESYLWNWILYAQVYRCRERDLEGRLRELQGEVEQREIEMRRREWSHTDTLQEKEREIER